MPRVFQITELEPVERRVAMMHVANASIAVIAQMLECSPGTVQNILARPHVARFILLLHGTVSEGLEDGISDLNTAFKEKAKRAFTLEAQAMEDLHTLGNEAEKDSTRVRAKLGVVFTAKDILDRAGHRAPTKVYNYGNSEIPPEAAEALTQAARELAEIRRAERAIPVEVVEVVGGNPND